LGQVSSVQAGGQAKESKTPFQKVDAMDQITLKTPNPKCRFFLKIDLYGDLAAGVYLTEAPSPPRSMFGVIKAIL
jgi:hypothetical protein